MADLLLFGRLADARRARPRRFRLCNAHLDEYLSENDDKSRFRFGRDSINYLADLFSDDLARNIARNHALSPLAQVLVALRFFASGSFLEVIGDTFGLPKSTVSRCITAVSQALVRRRSTYVHCLAGWGPENHIIKQAFFAKNGFPGVALTVHISAFKLHVSMKTTSWIVKDTILEQAICDHEGESDSGVLGSKHWDRVPIESVCVTCVTKF